MNRLQSFSSFLAAVFVVLLSVCGHSLAFVPTANTRSVQLSPAPLIKSTSLSRNSPSVRSTSYSVLKKQKPSPGSSSVIEACVVFFVIRSNIRSQVHPLQMSASGDTSEFVSTKKSTRTVSRKGLPLVTHLNSRKELESYLVADDRITLISFHASWCKSCQRFGLLFKRLAKDKADWAAHTRHKAPILEDGSARMASIEWAANTKLCRSLGVERLPSVHFYKNGRKLSGFPAGPSKFQIVKDRLAYYESLSDAELEFEADLQQGSSLVDAAILEQSHAKQATAPLTGDLELDFASTLQHGSSLVETVFLQGQAQATTSLQAATKGRDNSSTGSTRKFWSKMFQRKAN